MVVTPQTVAITVPLLYGGIQMLEFSAVLARVAGLKSGKPMLGYSIQQSVYMGTRLLLVMLLPILGYLVDAGMTPDELAVMSHVSLLVAGVLGIMVLALRGQMVRYYVRVIQSYTGGRALWRAFLRPAKGTSGGQVEGIPLNEGWNQREVRDIFKSASVVFLIYSTGLFLAFHLSASVPEYRTTLSHISGIFNALGAFLLTFVVEPRISVRIDEKALHASAMVMALFLGRLFAVLVLGQFFLLLVIR